MPAEPSRTDTASTGLLRQVKSHDEDAWRRLVRIYGPLVYCRSGRSGLQGSDAEDIVGDVFADLAKGVELFQADGNAHSFRRWLRTIVSRKIKKHVSKMNSQPLVSGGTTANLRIQALVADVFCDEETSDEVDWLRQRAAKVLKDNCKPLHRQIFQRTILDGQSPEEVAQALEVKVWTVYYKVRSRLLHRLRAELDELS